MSYVEIALLPRGLCNKDYNTHSSSPLRWCSQQDETGFENVCLRYGTFSREVRESARGEISPNSLAGAVHKTFIPGRGDGLSGEYVPLTQGLFTGAPPASRLSLNIGEIGLARRPAEGESRCQLGVPKKN